MVQPALFKTTDPLEDSSLPASVIAHVWRGNEMGGRQVGVVGTGFRSLDRELPGGGWPCQSLTELLLDPGTHCEWRLLASALSRIQKKSETVFLVGAPFTPHLPGLRLMGVDEKRLVWVKAESARERLWATQQILQSAQAGAVLAWLPQVDARSLRRLQTCTQACEAPAFVLRPLSARHETSPAPLRIEIAQGDVPWRLQLRVIKRRGPQLDRLIELSSIPGALTQVLAKRGSSGAIGGSASNPVQHPLPLRLPLPSPATATAALSFSPPDPANPPRLPIPIPLHRIPAIPQFPSLPPPPTFIPIPVTAANLPITEQEQSDVLLAGALLPPLRRAAY